MSKLATAILASALSLAMGPAFAQETPTLSVEGDVMVSSGGEFVTATDGQEVAAGDSIMVQEDSAVTITYDNGCSESHTEPGTYEVDEDCVVVVPVQDAGAAYASTGGSAMSTALIVGGVVAASAAIIHSNLDGDPVPPISP